MLLNTLAEIETDEQMIMKQLANILDVLLDHITNMFDSLITTVVNMFSKSKIKTVFPEWRRKKQGDKNTIKLPDGTVVIIDEE